MRARALAQTETLTPAQTGWRQQMSPPGPEATNSTANGTNASVENATQTVLHPEFGPVGQVLSDAGIPYAAALGAAITFLAVLMAVYLVGRALIVPLFGRLLDRRGVDPQARRPLQRVMKLVMFGGALAIAFGVAGYGNFLTSMAAIGAAATLAIGLAVQDVIKNIVAGVFIYTDRPFRIGDWIEWDDGGTSYAGIVEDISFRVTRVRTFNNELLTVPNATLTDGVIKNPVAKEELRTTFVFGISYDDDIERASDIIVDVATEHDEILADPAPEVRLTELADSYVGLKAFTWISDPDRMEFMRIRSEYVTTVKQRFDAAGIEIPFPQRDLSGGGDVAGKMDRPAQYGPESTSTD